MSDKLEAHISKTINAPVNKVWHALTDPAQIKKYLFGTEAKSVWKKGSPITYTGVWEGKPYEDKGTIIDIVPEQLLHTTYFSGMSGKEDKPENYANVKYILKPERNHTIMTIKQDNIDNEAQLKHMEQNWSMVLDGLKNLLEK